MKSIQETQQSERDEILAALWDLVIELRTIHEATRCTAYQKAKELIRKKKLDAGIPFLAAPQMELLK